MNKNFISVGVKHKINFSFCPDHDKMAPDEISVREDLSNLHNRAFSFFGPRIIFLIDSVNKWIIFLVFLYKLAHPKKKKERKKFDN